MNRSRTALSELATENENIYRAARPGYSGNFSRDSLTYGLLADDLEALEAQVDFSARLQGQQADSYSGEEPGKIHHEWPGVTIRGLSTTYNACDTTALFLLSIARLAKRGQAEVMERHRSAVVAAARYITSHLIEGIFYEDTRQSGSERFALKVTYWKDSELNTTKKEPHYPIAYSLVHFQNKAGLQEIAEITGNQELGQLATYMARRGIEEFWRDNHFIVARERNGSVIDTPSSDSLHSLLYLKTDEIEQDKTEAIEQYSEQLATSGGYLPALQQVADLDNYHTGFVWVHEQALLHAAAQRHNLKHAKKVSMRILPTLEKGFPELTDPIKNFEGTGNPTQLWSIGAYLYFERLKAKIALQQQLGGINQLKINEEKAAQ